MPNTFYKPFDSEYLPATGPAPREDHRTPFQVDRDRVIFSYAFRRLQWKTQVFQSGISDKYRSRLTHSIEVAQIARSICDYLPTAPNSPLNSDFHIASELVEAVGLAHDLGHPPYGHIGERTLNHLMAKQGGFEGNAQTLRILTHLIFSGGKQSSGLCPTRAFLDGVMKYKPAFSEAVADLTAQGKDTPPKNHFLYDDQAHIRNFVCGGDEAFDSMRDIFLHEEGSIECQIMDWADDAAYCLHDIQDGMQMGMISGQALETWAAGKSLGELEQTLLEGLIHTIKNRNVEAILGRRIGTFINACSLEKRAHPLTEKTNRYAFHLHIAPEIVAESKLYKQIAFDLLFRSPQLTELEEYAHRVVTRLFEVLEDQFIHDKPSTLGKLPQALVERFQQGGSATEPYRRLCDTVADMSDMTAPRLYNHIFGLDASNQEVWI